MRGIATDEGIPWNIPSDSQYYKDVVATDGRILMGYNTYLNHETTITDRVEFVATSHTEPLRSGFTKAGNIDTFLDKMPYVWVIGGSKLFEHALPLANYLYITQVEGDFNCTKFFPEFEKDFELVRKSKIQEENGYKFQYQIWESKKTSWQKRQIPV